MASDDSFLEIGPEIISIAKERGILLRLMGALAVRIHCPEFGHLFASLGREISDLDFMAYSRDEKGVSRLLENLNYKLHVKGLNLFTNRLIYRDNANSYNMDVFFDKLSMCHTIDFKGRLELDYPTITLTDILLTKLQIVKINPKDLKDIIILLREHDVGKGDKETIDMIRLSQILCDDWGFFYTFSTNLKKIQEQLLTSTLSLSADDKKNVTLKIDKILDELEKEPKSIRWKIRSRIGTSKKWYTDIEEVIR